MGDKPTPNYYWIVDDSRTQIWQFDSNTVYVPFDVLQKIWDGPDAKTPTKDGEKIRTRAHDRHPDQSQAGRRSLHRSSRRFRRSCDSVSVQSTASIRQDPVMSGDVGKQPTTRFLAGGREGKDAGHVAVRHHQHRGDLPDLLHLLHDRGGEDARTSASSRASGRPARAWRASSSATAWRSASSERGLGSCVGYLIVHNINELHTWLGQAMGVMIWDPEVYAFDTIPNTMNPRRGDGDHRHRGRRVASWRAGAGDSAQRDMNPVDALRWE